MHKLIMLMAAMLILGAGALCADEFFVSPDGSDANPGTREQPFATPAKAQQAARVAKARGAVTVYFRAGTYYLPETLVFTAADSGTKDARVVYRAYGKERPVISGGAKLKLTWDDYRDGIRRADVPNGMTSDQLFVDGVRRPMARYPNYDPDELVFNGFAADCFGPQRATRWADPTGGFIHAMHRSRWGDFHYRILGKKDDGNVEYEGGWQNNRRYGMHGQHRFVENIFEELDAPGEWFFDAEDNALYFYPPEGLDLGRALVEGVRLRHLVEFRGTQDSPVRFLALAGLTFRHTARTFMDNKEPLLRSDWTTYRGGAIFFDGAEDCTLADCMLDQLGGNGVFINNYNRRIAIRECHIREAGANAVAFVGDPDSVRSPLFEYSERQNYADMDKEPGPKTENFPAECLVEDCLIYRNGQVEKQTAGVQISMAQDITVRHCSIYDVPRAGINISEGTFGGHVIEFCDVFDTVQETGDHGSFNSWGRDRFWGLKDVDLNTITTGELKELPLLDVVKPVVLRNNRWRCDHGWDIDLDDGSSNYQVVNNLCLNGGIKHREGFYRTCENNIMVGNSFHPHVWYRHSQDTFRRNIVFTAYRPIRVPQPWGKECDWNLLHAPGWKESRAAEGLQKQSGLDRNSIKADAMFLDPSVGDYRVAEDSPAIKLGFKNFPMDRFGVRKPELKALARTPRLPDADADVASEAGSDATKWLGATVKSLRTEGEKSATGMHDTVGVLLVDVPSNSAAATLGFRTLDVVYALGSKKVDNLAAFQKQLAEAKVRTQITATVWRSQSERKLTWKVKE